jgi:hypothetical protein
LAEAYAWYEGQRPGLGDEYLDAIARCVASIERHPLGNAVVMKNVRQALVRRFPYSVFYVILSDEIVVRGIFHAARNPAAWKRRLRNKDV